MLYTCTYLKLRTLTSMMLTHRWCNG